MIVNDGEKFESKEEREKKSESDLSAICSYTIALIFSASGQTLFFCIYLEGKILLFLVIVTIFIFRKLIFITDKYKYYLSHSINLSEYFFRKIY